MSEIRDIPLDIKLTENEGKILDELWEYHDMSYSEIIGKALRAYYSLEKLIELHEVRSR